MPDYRNLLRLSLLFCFLVCGPVSAQAGAGAETEVTVSVTDGKVIVDARYRVAATPQEAWAALTDFEHMDDFISNLGSSKIISRSGDRVQVAQKGNPSRGLLSYPFDVIREFRLVPFEKIYSRVLSGTIRKFDGTTTLTAEGASTLIVAHSESVTDVWIPPVIGPSFIKSEVEEQVQEMRKEILRRKQAAAAP